MIKSIEIDENLENYISNNSYDLHPVQREIIKHNNSLGEIKKMQISVTQAYFMQLLIKSKNLKKILEIGTFTGYSALSMALAVKDDGFITCVDKNKNTSDIAKTFFKKAKIDNKINLIVGSALEQLNILSERSEKFDLIFIDADKENYINYYEKSIVLIGKNGLIIIDNVLWHGEVADNSKNDKFTNIIREFNKYIKDDNRVIKNIIPIGDGLTICIKK